MNKRQYPPGIEEDKQEWLEAIENIYGAYGCLLYTSPSPRD